MLLAGRQAFLIAFVTCVVNFLRVFPFNYNRNQQDCGYFATQIKMGPSATRVTHCNQLSHFYVHSNVFSVCLYAPTLSQKLISLVPLVKKPPHYFVKIYDMGVVPRAGQGTRILASCNWFHTTPDKNGFLSTKTDAITWWNVWIPYRHKQFVLLVAGG